MVNALNRTVDLAIKANAFYQPLVPKQGIMALGDQGLEFRAVNGVGYIQIPWKNIVQVRAHVYFKGRYIRGFDVETDEQQVFNFVTSDTRNALRVMKAYLDSQKLVKAKSNFKQLFRKKEKTSR